MCAGPPEVADGGAPLKLNKRRGNGLDRGNEASPPCRQPATPGVQGFLAPKSLGEVKELARMIALAEWAPDCYRDLDGNYLQPKIELAILHGTTVGLGPIAAVHAIALINGTPSIWGDGALSVIEHSGLLEDMTEDYEVGGEEGLTAICTMKRRDRATPIVTRFSLAMAARAGLTRVEGPWQSYPERMLRMRARSWTMRDGFADVLRGLQLREEVEDYRSPRPSPSGRGVDQQPAANGAPSHHSPRPRFVAADPPTAPLAAVPLPPSAEEVDKARDDRLEPTTGHDTEIHTLVDADGVVVEVEGADALRAAFEQMILGKHLSPEQIVGIWESNEAARTIIERVFGAQALGEAEERLPVRDDYAERTSPPPNATVSGNGAAQVHPAEPNQSLVLEIDPAWGIQKIFHHYRAALTALADGGKRDEARISRFRQANGSLEQRLRTKLPGRMPEIDATYQSLGSTRSPPRKQRRSVLPREGSDQEMRPTS